MSLRTYALAAALGLSVAAAVSPVAAQDSARDAAIAKCVKEAQTRYPEDTGDMMRQRAATYIACMTREGQRP